MRCEYDNQVIGGRWIECTWKTDDGTLHGWYHNEPSGLCAGTQLIVPRIGAVRSTDNGGHWQDPGVVLEAPPGTLDCATTNYYFVMLLNRAIDRHWKQEGVYVSFNRDVRRN